MTRALDVIAREGYRGASVKEIADAVGLSQAGLLHYFASKEELFTEVLRKRDEADLAFSGFEAVPASADVRDIREGYLSVIRHNAEVPGLVQLFAQLSVDAADPEHPAHRFFIDRGALLRSVFADALARRFAEGGVAPRVPPETLARIFQAVTDGLQLQWMLEPDLDMAATIDVLFELVFTHARAASDDPPDGRAVREGGAA
nr:TetR/AcrR family transcriptional regulator [Microbacterium immunditiarum]